MTVRRLEPADAVPYRALLLAGYAQDPDAFTAALPLSWWTARLDASAAAGQIVLGAFDGDRLVGAAGLEFEAREKARHKASLFGMYVAADVRQGGFGLQLVEAALAQAVGRDGVRLVQLTVTEGNLATQALYERCGFKVFGVEPYAVAIGGTFLSKVHMWRALRPLA